MNPLRPAHRFKGIRLPPGYEDILKDAVEQDQKDPEDQFSPDAHNELAKKWGGSFNG